MWQANNYTGLSSVTITLFLYSFISSHNVRNCCKCWLVARGGDDYTRRKQQQWKTLNANHIAACQGIIRTVPYYSVFQQLVICLIGALEFNGIIIKTETDRGRRGHCGHILNETSMFWGGGTKKSAVWIQDGEPIPIWKLELSHLEAFGRLGSVFIYKVTRLLCSCHMRLNNNSFHVHHKGKMSRGQLMTDWRLLQRAKWHVQCSIKQ